MVESISVTVASVAHYHSSSPPLDVLVFIEQTPNDFFQGKALNKLLGVFLILFTKNT
jgi:hypothetical protein